jgi:hypothetical protein
LEANTWCVVLALGARGSGASARGGRAVGAARHHHGELDGEAAPPLGVERHRAAARQLGEGGRHVLGRLHGKVAATVVGERAGLEHDGVAPRLARGEERGRIRHVAEVAHHHAGHLLQVPLLLELVLQHRDRRRRRVHPHLALGLDLCEHGRVHVLDLDGEDVAPLGQLTDLGRVREAPSDGLPRHHARRRGQAARVEHRERHAEPARRLGHHAAELPAAKHAYPLLRAHGNSLSSRWTLPIAR